MNAVIANMKPVIPAINPVIPAINPVIPAINPVIPAINPVIPAEAGIHDRKPNPDAGPDAGGWEAPPSARKDS